MPTRILFVLRTVATIAGIASCLVVQSARAQTIIDQWSSVTAPQPPPLKAVMIDKSTTARAAACPIWPTQKGENTSVRKQKNPNNTTGKKKLSLG